MASEATCLVHSAITWRREQIKTRIDKLLVERGLAQTREKAQALIMAGNVLVDDAPATKPGMTVSSEAKLQIKAAPHPYVSRGGVKLEGAVIGFGVQIRSKVCVDIGSSTGGFTHFLLMQGAERVYAVDVDIKQLDWQLRNHPRVRPVELNARFLAPQSIGEAVDLVTVDASFISLTMLLPRIPAIMKNGAECLVLVKPQFEVGREHVGKGGIVRDESLQKAAVAKVVEAGRSLGLDFLGARESPITGREGNREFFVLFRKI